LARPVMPANEYKRRILEAVAEVLRAAGFRKKGSHFTRDIAEVVHLVTLQSSVGNTADAVRVTVNLGVWIPALEGDAKPDIWSAHWRERLGFLMPEKRDVWWDAASDGEANVVAGRIADAVRDFGLPALSQLASRRALLDLWKTGASPGLTEVET
jgi:hypothetical protein